MDVVTLVEILKRAGVRLGISHSGNLLAIDVPAELEVVIDRYRVSLVHAVLGVRTKHRWRVCPACREEAIADRGARCRMTPHCVGKMADDIVRPTLEHEGLPVFCCRPGCGDVAVALTFGNEPVCHTDLAHLGLLIDYRRKDRRMTRGTPRGITPG